jgi:hypothetical protein
VRDPWFPVALIGILVLTAWLGILGPMPDGVSAWLKEWQTLLSAVIAVGAAYVAFQNTTRALRHSEKLETNRRSRKHAAVRAVLPLALAHDPLCFGLELEAYRYHSR